MELLIDNGYKKKVFTFDGSLGSPVWESEPITRFRFKEPVTNGWVKIQLGANKPTSGIVFNKVPYIGTNDGFIYTPDKKIQRIPNIKVDTNFFIDEFPFENGYERNAFARYKKSGIDAIRNSKFLRRVLEIDKTFNTLAGQERNLDRYIMGKLAIRGFVIDKDSYSMDTEVLYDGHLLGITETDTGRTVNDLAPHALYQIDPTTGGFVPSRYPPVAATKFIIEDGIEREEKAYCVDYHSLWTLSGQGRFVEGICPRDGSGYAPAKFATDGKIIAVSHGDHPCYRLDITNQTGHGEQEKIKSIDLDSRKLPHKLLVRNGMVYGDSGNTITNYSTGKNLFVPSSGQITSISDSGLCTVKEGIKTIIYNPFVSKKPIDSMTGSYTFLSRAPQL